MISVCFLRTFTSSISGSIFVGFGMHFWQQIADFWVDSRLFRYFLGTVLAAAISISLQTLFTGARSNASFLIDLDGFEILIRRSCFASKIIKVVGYRFFFERCAAMQGLHREGQRVLGAGGYIRTRKKIDCSRAYLFAPLPPSFRASSAFSPTTSSVHHVQDTLSFNKYLHQTSHDDHLSRLIWPIVSPSVWLAK